jgi:RES domain-containing protein
VAVTPHSAYDTLRRALADAAVAPWSGVLFRFATPRYATSADLVTGAGAQKWGGRWNAPGTFPVVYGSLTPEVALAETFHVSRRYGLPDAEVTPRVLTAVRVSVTRAIDLTVSAHQRALGAGAGQLVEEPWRQRNQEGAEALTQVVGRAAHDLGAQAMLVPSAVVRDGQNLLVFPRHLEPGQIEIVHPDQLPRG